MRLRFRRLRHPGVKIGGKWDADLDVDDSEPVAELSITISIYFNKVDYDGEIVDGRRNIKRIIAWKPDEFEQFKNTLLYSAQQFWDKFFWLKTPRNYRGLDWPDAYPRGYPSHQCNVSCRLLLIDALSSADAHYTIDVVRLADDESEMVQDSLHFSNRIMDAAKIDNPANRDRIWQWPHFHEVGHLLGLGHVNHRDLMKAKGMNDDTAYGITKSHLDLSKLRDVMGMGSAKNKWHAEPWQEAAAMITGTKKQDWGVSMGRLKPVLLDPTRAMSTLTGLPGLPGRPVL